MRIAVAAILVCAALTAPGVSLGDLQIEGYQPNLHDRFYVGDDRAFIGEAFDWSGVGRDEGHGYQWAVMISPTYFVTAGHWPPNDYDTLTFHEDNSPTGAVHQYQVAPVSYYATTLRVGGTTYPSDLYLGKLTAPIPESDHITYYPVLDLPTTGAYVGLPIYVNGKPNRVGRNVIDRFVIEEEGSPVNKATLSMEYDYNTTTGLGADECYLMVYDSGGPSFVNVGGRLALVGIHYYNDGTPPANGKSSGDSFVPYYIDQLNAHMAGEQLQTLAPLAGDANVDGIVDQADYTVWYNRYGSTGATWSDGDFNSDGGVDQADYTVWYNNYGRSGTAAAPEPTTICLMAMGGMATLRARRRIGPQQVPGGRHPCIDA